MMTTCTNGMFGLRRAAFGARGAVLLAGGLGLVAVAAMPSEARAGFRIGIDINQERREPVCETPTRIWVEPVYKTVCEKVWVEPVYRSCDERVWVPARYEEQQLVRRRGGRKVVECVQVLVEPAHYEVRARQVEVTPGYWAEVKRQVLVTPGHWREVQYEGPIVRGRIEYERRGGDDDDDRWGRDDRHDERDGGRWNQRDFRRQ